MEKMQNSRPDPKPPTGTAVSAENHSPETSTRKRCLVQPQAVTSNRNQVSRTRLVATSHRFLRGGPPPRAMHPSVRLTPQACSENRLLRQQTPPLQSSP